MTYVRDVGIEHCRFIPRQHKDEISVMTELVLGEGIPNLFPQSGLSSSPVNMGKKLSEDLTDISKVKVTTNPKSIPKRQREAKTVMIRQ